MRRVLPDLVVVVVLFLLPLGFFFQQTLGGKTLIPSENLFQYEPYATYSPVVKAPPTPHNHLLSDLVLQNYQWKAFIRQQIGIGEVPLWNPYQLGGVPFLAAGQHSALYPLSVIYYVLDLASAYGWFTVVNLWLAGVGMFGFLRGLGVGRGGALLAGIVYQLCGFVLASVVFQMMIGGFVWLPILLWMAERLITQKGNPLPNAVIGAIALGLNILAGHAEITIYTLLIAGYYSAVRLLFVLWQTRHVMPILIRGIWLSVMVGLGLGLGAVQLVPLFEFVQTNWRAERASLQTVLTYAHPVRDVLQFIMPNFYGNPAHHQYLDVFTGQIVTQFTNASNTPYIDWGIKNYVESALYLGILPLLLALFALLPHAHIQRWNAHKFTFASLGLFSLTCMFGLPTYALVYVLPGINQLNSPFRWIYALTVCVAVLAGMGLDALKHTTFSRRHQRMAWGMVGLGVLILGALGLSRIFYALLQPFIERVYMGMANAQNAFSDADMFYSYQFINVLIFGAMLTLSGLVWVWASRAPTTKDRWGGITKWQIGAVVLVAVDLMIASWGFNPASDPELLKFTPPVVTWLQTQQANEGNFRYITLDDPMQRPLMQANSTMQYGLEDVRGYDSIIPKSYVGYINDIVPPMQLDFNRIAPLYSTYPTNSNFDVNTALQNPRLWWLNVRYIVAHKTLDLDTPTLTQPIDLYQLAYSDEVVNVWRVNLALDRIMVCCGDAPTTEETLAWLQSGDVLDTNKWQDVWQALSFDRAIRQSPRYFQNTGREKWFSAQLSQARWLLISEQLNGWRAFVRPMGTDDGKELPLDIQRVNGIFMGVQLPPGDWTVRLVYSPPSFQIGLFGSIISVAILTLAIGAWLWQWFVGVNTESSSTTARVARNSIAPILLNLFNRGIDFAFLLVMLRLLAPQDVGTYNYLVVVFVWFDIFSNFGLNLFLIREVSRDKTQASYLFFNTSFLRLILVAVGVVGLIAFIILRQTTVQPVLDSAAIVTLCLLYGGLVFGTLNQGISALFYAFEQAEKPSTIATITTIFKAIFGVVVLVLGWGIVGLAIVSVFNNFITLCVLGFTARPLIGTRPAWRIDFALIRRMVRQSWALLLNNFLATIFFQIDVVILEAYKGATIVAKYSVSYKWLLAINIIPSFFTQALLPVMSRQAQEDVAILQRTYRFGIKLMWALALPMAVGFTFLAVPLTAFMGGSQYLPEGAIALVLMIWSIPLGWMNSLTQYALIALELQRRITIAFFCAVLFNIVTNIVLIPQYSFVAAAITTIASEGVLFVLFAILMNRGLKTRLNWAGILWRPAIATGAMFGVAYVLSAFNVLLALAIASVVYVGVLIALKPLDESERELFAKILPTRLIPLVRRVGLVN
jgi:O-antigen/teichoic acid export membrane protein